jgi:hypothetical protein
MSHVSPTRSASLLWDKETGWIFWRRSNGTRPVRLCWLPLELRGDSFAWHDTTTAIGAHQGAVTIMDFSDIIAMLKVFN